MFRETITSADGSTAEGACSEAHAMYTLGRAVRLGYRVEATRHGGAVVVREIPACTDRWQLPKRHTVTIEPVMQAGRVTDVNRLDLELVSGRGGSRMQGDRIKAGYLNSIPPGAAGRLIARGLVTVADDGVVTVSLVARLAMLAQDHHTETREPRGYVRPLDIGNTVSAGLNKPGGRAGKVYDRSSVASCSCRRWSYPAEDREDARRRAYEHRQEVTAALVRDLGSEAG
jgi:hypothetical protein